MPTAAKRKSLCKGKSVSKPNRCRKLRGCKVAKGPKRTFCRKSKNMTRKRLAAKKRPSTYTRRWKRVARLVRQLE